LALLRNLRLMQNAEVPRKVIAGAIEAMRADRVLPYRFIAAARYAPDFEPELESAMLKSIKGYARLSGRTRLLIDVSGSMDRRSPGSRRCRAWRRHVASRSWRVRSAKRRRSSLSQ
jgi:hypothetical protein